MTGPSLPVLPGFRPRLSLNERHGLPGRIQESVLPGFRPRLSLNGRSDPLGTDRRQVLPGFRPRLSLNEHRLPELRFRMLRRVAGVPTPALIERAATRATSTCPPAGVLPGFRPRLSLNDLRHRVPSQLGDGVAGVPTPALIERPSPRCAPSSPASSIAGVPTPALIERPPTT